MWILSGHTDIFLTKPYCTVLHIHYTHWEIDRRGQTSPNYTIYDVSILFSILSVILHNFVHIKNKTTKVLYHNKNAKFRRLYQCQRYDIWEKKKRFFSTISLYNYFILHIDSPVHAAPYQLICVQLFVYIGLCLCNIPFHI